MLGGSVVRVDCSSRRFATDSIPCGEKIASFHDCRSDSRIARHTNDSIITHGEKMTLFTVVLAMHRLR